MEREPATTLIKTCMIIHYCTFRAKLSFVSHMGLIGSTVRTRLSNNRDIPNPTRAHIQCPYNAHTVPIQCPYSAHCKNTQCPYICLVRKRRWSSFIFLEYIKVWALWVFTMGTVWALYGYCMGTVWALGKAHARANF